MLWEPTSSEKLFYDIFSECEHSFSPWSEWRPHLSLIDHRGNVVLVDTPTNQLVVLSTGVDERTKLDVWPRDATKDSATVFLGSKFETRVFSRPNSVTFYLVGKPPASIPINDGDAEKLYATCHHGTCNHERSNVVKIIATMWSDEKAQQIESIYKEFSAQRAESAD
jgi:hypothetical protein